MASGRCVLCSSVHRTDQAPCESDLSCGLTIMSESDGNL
jgi:hypothetical protein